MDKILTIIVPSYNMEKYLSRCLDSFLINDKDIFRKLEVIVVNDGSKDNTSNIAHQFEKQCPEVIKVIDKENGNYGSCIECGLYKARGKYIKVIDADDWVDKENFERYIVYLVEQSHTNDGADLILNDFEFIYLGQNLRERKSYSFVLESGFTVAGFTYRNGREMWMHAAAYKTDKLRSIGYTQMHGVSYTDEEWISLPMTTVETIGYFPDVVYEYMLGRQGQTCAPDEYLKGFWMQVLILRKLIAQYVERRDQWGHDQEIYMQNHLMHRLELTYKMYLFRTSKYLDNSVIVEFDKFLQDKSRMLYERSGKILLESWYKYHFVSVWRKRRKKTFLFFANVIIMKALRKVKSVVKCVKDRL